MRVKSSLLPVIYLGVLWGVQATNLRRFVADDAYFYLVIARNLATQGEQTFSGIMPTNGVHPLWIYMLGAWDWLVGGVCSDCLYRLESILPISLSVLALGVWAGWQVAHKLNISPFLFTSLPLGCLSTLNMLGFEAFALYASLMLLCLFTLDTAMPRNRRAFAIGLAGAAVLLARLDSVFFIAVFYIWFWLRYRDARDWGMAALTTAVPAGCYLFSNLYFFGGMVPVSGWLKSTFPVFQTKNPFHYFHLTSSVFGYNLMLGIFPILLGSLVILLLRRKIRGDASLLYAFWGGSVLHFIYNAGYMRTSAAWLWYYVLPILSGTLALALIIKFCAPVLWQPRLATAISGLAAAFFLAYTLRALLRPLPPSQAELMLNYLQANHITGTILVADGPGEVAFFGRNRVLALDMLTANQNFVKAMLASPNSLQFILDQAAEKNHPITNLLFTTDTIFGSLSPSADFETVRYGFLTPGSASLRSFSSLTLGRPVYQQPGLVVWKIQDSSPP